MRSRILVMVFCSALLRAAGATSIDEVRNNPVAHRGKTLELTGRIAGTIISGKGHTVMIDLGREGYVYVKDVTDPNRVQNDMRVTVAARVPAHATNASEFEFISATPEKVAPPPPGVASADSAGATTIASAMIPVRPPQPSTRSAPAWSGATAPVVAPLATNLEETVRRLKPAYANAIAYFNRRLTAGQRDQFADAILRFSLQNDRDPRLVMAVIAVESSFDPTSTSRSGAMGLGQLMPGTAAGMGVYNAYDPIANIHATVRLINGHLNNYKNHKEAFNIALAAYNAGSGAVRKHNGVPPYSETTRYIWKVYNLYKQLAPDRFP